MLRNWLLAFWLGLTVAQTVSAQKTDSLVRKLDSLHRQHDTLASRRAIRQDLYNERTRVNVPVYLALLGSDFKQEVTGPFHSSTATWTKVGAFAVLETGMFLLDKDVQRKATDLMRRNGKLRGLSHYITNFGGDYEAYTLAALGLYSLVFRNEKLKTTTLLATQSYIVGATMETLIKILTGRERPNGAASNPSAAFRGPNWSFSPTNTTSFPSGHTTVAFAAATVFALEYRDRPLVPVMAYSAATLVGLSRITENAHWLSDVFAGAALGYVTGLQVVRNYHRFAWLRNHHTRKNAVSLGMQLNYNHLEPAIYLRFR